MSLEKVITDISGMFPQYFDFNSQLRPYEFWKRSGINATATSATGKQLTLNDWTLGEQWILFPENLNVSRDEVEGNIEIRGKQNSLFPKGPVIKWFVI